MPHIRDEKNGKRYTHFRMDVRIRRQKYELFKQECQLLHITPSAKVRELVDQWLEGRLNNESQDDKWKIFIERVKADGFNTPEEWVKARLGI